MARSTMTTPFVAREEQVSLVMAALERAARGRPGMVLVGGDAGVGKTRLLTEVSERARQAGAITVTTHCVDLGEVGLPYLPFAEALGVLRTQSPVVDEWTTQRPELARLVPGGSAVAPADDQSVRLQLFDAIGGVLGAVGKPGAPVLLVLEDLHWADSSSRDVLRFLLARMRDEHLLVVATYRTDDLHRRHPLRPVLAELWRQTRVERVDLMPFTPDELRQFTTAVLGHAVPQAVLDRVVERSEGNAYFAEELLESGVTAESLPGTLADVLRARLDNLDPAVQRLARVAAVAGRRVTEPLLRAVVASAPGEGLDASTVDDALRDAVAHHVLAGEEGRIAFRHALLAEVVYGDLLPGEQSLLHRAYLRAITADPSLAPASRLAMHALRAPDLPAALVASHRAAQDAAVLLAPAEELRHLETVLRIWDAVPDASSELGADRVDVLARAAAAASRAGQNDRAVALARDAVTEAGGDGDGAAGDARGSGPREDPRLAGLRTALARYLLGNEREEEALLESTLALTELGPQGSALERAWALATHARACLMRDKDAEATASATQAVEAARRAPDGSGAAAEADALATLAVLVVDDTDAAAHLLASARDRAAAAGDVVTEQRCAYNLATTLYYAGRLDEAASELETGLARAHAAGLTWSPFGVAQRFFVELVHYMAGDLTEAEEASGHGRDLRTAVLDSARSYSAVARGDYADLVEGAGSRPWSPDGQIALITGGCTIDALTWAG
ncbi:MAG TPA: AAA family ATPase, partial [Actinotalea sp.]